MSDRVEKSTAEEAQTAATTNVEGSTSGCNSLALLRRASEDLKSEIRDVKMPVPRMARRESPLAHRQTFTLTVI
jgi:hypothetical protein